MIEPVAAILPCGKRLHLQHGPIDLIVGADGDRQSAFAAAQDRFATVLNELVDELLDLRRVMTSETSVPKGCVALRLDQVTRPYANDMFVTRMAAVAGGVADTVLEAMKQSGELSRAYVNNGGDIALHLAEEQSFSMAIAKHDNGVLGHIEISADNPVRGIATSGRHGRSFSLGIADSVTVLARTAAAADVAATLIANAVDLPKHPAIHRKPANTVFEDSDLGATPVVVGCGLLPVEDCRTALQSGLDRAHIFWRRGLIDGAALFLQDHNSILNAAQFSLEKRIPVHA